MAEESNIRIVMNWVMNGFKEAKQGTQDIAEAQKDFSGKTKEAAQSVSVLKKALTGVQNASSGVTKTLNKFVKSLGRIFLYRTVRKVLSEIAQAFKEGVKNVYAYSVAMNNTDSTHAASNLDSLATSVLYLKNCLGAMLTPVIQAITPIVYQMSDAFATATRNITQMFAVLGGASVGDGFTYAKRFGTQFADSLASASGSAKEIKRTLLGFDEINRLDAPDTGSGGGATTDLDMSDAFAEGTISEKAKKIADIIKNVILPIVVTVGSVIGGWFVGSKIAEGVSSVAQSFGVLEKTAKALGSVVGGITLIVAGLGLIVYGVMDVINTGGRLKSWLAILSGIAIVVVGVALAFGGIPALITGIVALVGALGLFVVTHWEQIKAKGKEVIESIKTKLSELWQRVLSIPVVGTIVGWVAKIEVAIVKILAKIIEIQLKIVQIAISIVKFCISKVGEFISSIASTFAAFVSIFYNTYVAPIVNYLKPIAQEFADFFGGLIKSVMNGIFSIIEGRINGFIQMLNTAIRIINKIPKVNISRISLLSLPRFANGGYVGEGQMFIANEAGAEMVGSMNGRTTVANNQQIVEGIKQGVIQAMQQSGNQNIVLNVDGKQLFDIMVGRNNSVVRTTGRSPLLV